METNLIKTLSIHLNIQIFEPTRKVRRVFLENEPKATPFLLVCSIERERMRASGFSDRLKVGGTLSNRPNTGGHDDQKIFD